MLARTLRRNWKFIVGCMIIYVLYLLIYMHMIRLPAMHHGRKVDGHTKVIHHANGIIKDENMTSHLSDNKGVNYLRTNKNKDSQSKPNIKRKIILVWTPFFNDWSWGNKDKILQNYLEGCPVKNCLLTKDRTFLPKADLLLFHCRDKVDKWPEIRHPNQIYALLCHEPPTTTKIDSFNNMINATVTYRKDSDMFLPYFPMGHLEKVPGRVTPYKPKIPLSSKTKGAIWMVSNCGAPSKRDLYMKELAKFIDVDIYGKCGDKICEKPKTTIDLGNEECLRNFERNYKFYIAFENNICYDYVTEKLYQPLKRELIPIVLGGADYSRLAPEHSVINVADFATPKDLASYLNYLSNNETAYYEYFKWKPHYTEEARGGKSWHHFCRLCDLAEKGMSPKTYGNIEKWWHSESTCDNNLVMKYLKN